MAIRTSKLRVSIVIRTYGKESLHDILHSIEGQVVHNTDIVEIVLVNGKDGDELDGVLTDFCPIIKKRIQEHAFSYGRSLNTGIAAAKGDFVALLSGHSVPSDRHWLSNLLEPFSTDMRVVGVVGAQRPYPDSVLIEKAYRHLWYCNRLLPRLLCVFNATNACIRKAYWYEHQFDEQVKSCEDRMWAWQARKNGHRYLYARHAQVWHSHNRNTLATLKELYDLACGAITAYFRFRKARND